MTYIHTQRMPIQPRFAGNSQRGGWPEGADSDGSGSLPTRGWDVQMAPPPPVEVWNARKGAQKARKKARRRNILLGFLASLIITPIAAVSSPLGQLGLQTVQAREHEAVYDLRKQPTKPPAEVLPPALAKQVQVVTFQTKTGAKLRGWYIPPKDGNPTVLYTHGRSGNVSNGGNMPFIIKFTDKGYGFFLFDPPGYGESEGEPSRKPLYDISSGQFLQDDGISEQGWYDGISAASEWLAKQHNTPIENQVLVGYSMGGAATIYQAQDKPYKAVMLVSTFTQMSDLTKFHNNTDWQHYNVPDFVHELFLKAPFLIDWLGTQKFPSIDRMPNIRAPLFVYYGQGELEDPYIPPEESGQLLRAAKNAFPVQLKMVPGNHTGITQQAGTFADDLEQYLKPIPPPK